MDSISAEQEIEEGERWKKIDPVQQFSLTSSKKCNVDDNNITAENNYNRYSVTYENSLPSRVLIFYKNGGPDLGNLPPLSENYEKIFSGFQNLFHGLVIAHKNNLVHTDIKPQNILSGDNANHLRFIDFGLSFETKYLDDGVNKMYSINSTYYPYWPFELGCFNQLGDIESEMRIRNRYQKFNNIFEDQTSFKIPFKTIYDTYKKTIFEKIDVYSMGITLIDLLRTYFHHYPFQNEYGKNYLVYYNLKTESYSRFETLPNKKWLSDKQLEYQNYLLKNVTQPLIDFINHCVDYNPNTRYNAEQAANEYKKLLPIFKTHLKQNDIRKGLAG